MADYEYEVFLSYKHHKLILPWIEGIEERLVFWLTQELGGEEPRVFFAPETIEAGANWPEALRSGLRQSKCLVAIWSPAYFRSKWCVSEWKSFQKRESEEGLIDGLILPIKFHDGEMFPDDAKARQAFDLSQYTSTTKAFWDTARADELDQRIRIFSAGLAKAVIGSPAFNPDWPIVEAEPSGEPIVNLRKFGSNE